ncbi:hypothetical protein L484_008491 [Morus notabilis]|uniref:Uncharacterized protein n=1 Tax=Morus notabilis TaxID=981085 RepID=W9SHJ6_9ROSA|nr:hypothetical protein L484_008491 [Morus notabilis]
MKLIWVLFENPGQNRVFKQNKVKLRVHQLTGDREVILNRLAGGEETGRPVGARQLNQQGQFKENLAKTCKFEFKFKIFQGKTIKSRF